MSQRQRQRTIIYDSFGQNDGYNQTKWWAIFSFCLYRRMLRTKFICLRCVVRFGCVCMRARFLLFHVSVVARSSDFCLTHSSTKYIILAICKSHARVAKSTICLCSMESSRQKCVYRICNNRLRSEGRFTLMRACKRMTLRFGTVYGCLLICSVCRMPYAARHSVGRIFVFVANILSTSFDESTHISMDAMLCGLQCREIYRINYFNNFEIIHLFHSHSFVSYRTFGIRLLSCSIKLL